MDVAVEGGVKPTQCRWKQTLPTTAPKLVQVKWKPKSPFHFPHVPWKLHNKKSHSKQNKIDAKENTKINKSNYKIKSVQRL